MRGVRALDSRGVERLAGIDLDIAPGEIVGLAGVSGSGQDEIVAVITGLRRAIAGRVTIAGRDATALSIAARRSAGLGYISADRAHEGLCLAETIAANVIAGRHRAKPFARRGLLWPKTIRTYANKALARFAIVYRDCQEAARTLSGGNQQRVVIARELDRNPRVLIAAQPTRGVDIAGAAFIHRQILAFAAEGGAVLLVSEEIEELLALADRILVLYRGAVIGEVAGADRSVGRIGRMMLGEAA